MCTAHNEILPIKIPCHPFAMRMPNSQWHGNTTHNSRIIKMTPVATPNGKMENMTFVADGMKF